jgi:hypothetical protein
MAQALPFFLYPLIYPSLTGLASVLMYCLDGAEAPRFLVVVRLQFRSGGLVFYPWYKSAYQPS